MALGPEALAGFDLPAAPQRVDDLPCPVSGAQARRIHSPAGRFLLLGCDAALAVAFEATLFELLAEAHFPAPRPRRARDGSMIVKLTPGAGACYPWPPGEELAPGAASVPQLMEIGRLLARLQQIGETHPVTVADPRTCATAPPPEMAGLPTGAVHGGVVPARALFIGERCSAVLPSGAACSAPLLLDLAQTAVGWMADAARPVAALRAISSGYQALRRLSPREKAAFVPVLQYAAARAGMSVAQLDPAEISGAL